jgi:hypothetical protein
MLESVVCWVLRTGFFLYVNYKMFSGIKNFFVRYLYENLILGSFNLSHLKRE